jgi:hypothetical protein
VIFRVLDVVLRAHDEAAAAGSVEVAHDLGGNADARWTCGVKSPNA